MLLSFFKHYFTKNTIRELTCKAVSSNMKMRIFLNFFGDFVKHEKLDELVLVDSRGFLGMSSDFC
jgi:hypothetical protein